MVDILAQIVADKRVEVALGRAAEPLDALKRAALDSAPPRDFFAALTQPAGTLRVIAEVKRASPSAGLIRPDFDPAALARAYHQHGAAAISCLTDGKYFQGSLDDLRAVRSAVPLPVLRKEFIIDPWQVYQSRANGADAVLLIAECLDDASLAELLDLALRLRMTVLVEIHDRANLGRAQALLRARPGQPILLGVNNRDLKRMVTDLGHSIAMAAEVDDRSRLVSESGIRAHGDILRLAQAGIHRVLVGEHLMRQPDVGVALRTLITGA